MAGSAAQVAEVVAGLLCRLLVTVDALMASRC
jgi:hypothetical protein